MPVVDEKTLLALYWKSAQEWEKYRALVDAQWELRRKLSDYDPAQEAEEEGIVNWPPKPNPLENHWRRLTDAERAEYPARDARIYAKLAILEPKVSAQLKEYDKIERLIRAIWPLPTPPFHSYGCEAEILRQAKALRARTMTPAEEEYYAWLEKTEEMVLRERKWRTETPKATTKKPNAWQRSR